MLPKIHRLPLRTEFKRTKYQGKTVSGDYFSLIFHKRTDQAASRFAFIVSKKVHPLSVGRNRIRRLMSEAVKSLLPQIPLNMDGVFLMRKAIVGKKLGEIQDEVEKILSKAIKGL